MGEDIVQWHSTCLACTEVHIQSLVPQNTPLNFQTQKIKLLTYHTLLNIVTLLIIRVCKLFLHLSVVYPFLKLHSDPFLPPDILLDGHRQCSCSVFFFPKHITLSLIYLISICLKNYS